MNCGWPRLKKDITASTPQTARVESTAQVSAAHLRGASATRSTTNTPTAAEQARTSETSRAPGGQSAAKEVQSAQPAMRGTAAAAIFQPGLAPFQVISTKNASAAASIRMRVRTVSSMALPSRVGSWGGQGEGRVS